MNRILLLTFILLSVAFASPSSVKHAALFEPYIKYQKSWINQYRSLKGNDPVQARILREMLAKKTQYQQILGKDFNEYNIKHKNLCAAAFLYTSLSFDNLYTWASDYRRGRDNPALFQAEMRKAETAIRDCKAL